VTRVKNDAILEEMDKNLCEKYHHDKLVRPQDNLQYLEYKENLVKDAQEYVRLINHLFKKKVGGKKPKGLICKRVTEFL
jgi:hypothetical protein